jgi:hypothetical protein
VSPARIDGSSGIVAECLDSSALAGLGEDKSTFLLTPVGPPTFPLGFGIILIVEREPLVDFRSAESGNPRGIAEALLQCLEDVMGRLRLGEISSRTDIGCDAAIQGIDVR